MEIVFGKELQCSVDVLEKKDMRRRRWSRTGLKVAWYSRMPLLKSPGKLFLHRSNHRWLRRELVIWEEVMRNGRRDVG